tara:strand:- start:347 stop:1726 length:1380 start_codon:yes stop_codon:yes gene_type:complete
MINTIVIISIIAILYIGLKTKSKPNSNSYLFAGRKLTLFPFVATLVSTWYGGILEIGRFSYENGIVTWLIFGFSYYIAAYIFSSFIAPKIITKNIQTIPVLIEKAYGKVAAIISIVLILFISSTAPYLKILSSIFQFLWPINNFVGITIGAIISLIYVFKGGFNSIIRTDKIQFIFMYLGFIVMLISAYVNYGGIDFLINNTPQNTFSIPGNLNWNTILIWGLIALVTFIDPSFYQRTFAGQSIKTVKSGIRLSILCWMVFDGLTVFTGIYASAILSDSINENPYLLLSQLLLPSFFQGIFIISLLFIVLSTIDSFSFISAYTFGKDLLNIVKIPIINNFSIKTKTQIGLLFTSIISIILAYNFNEVIDIWYTSGSFAVSVLLLPILFYLYDKKFCYPLFNMICSLCITFGWFSYGMINKQFGYPIYPLNLEPMFPGLFTSIFIWITCDLFVRFNSSKQ